MLQVSSAPSPSAPPSAFATALDALARAARAAAGTPVKRGARILLAEPWRLDLIVPGAADTDPDEVEALVRTQKDIMRDLGQRGHHAYDANQMLALRQAYVAVRLAGMRRRMAVAARPLPAGSKTPALASVPLRACGLNAVPAGGLPFDRPQAKRRPRRAVPLDLSGDNRLPAILDERASLRRSIAATKRRIAEIDGELGRKLGSADRAILPGWTILRAIHERAGYSVPPSVTRRLKVVRTDRTRW